MGACTLSGRRLLVVEDDYLLARDLVAALKALGADVVGPAASVARALALLADDPAIDGAVLDVNLAGDKVFPVADALAERGVPFLFTTGYDDWAMPRLHADAPRLQKPLVAEQAAHALAPKRY